jgi:hypothetical protein
VVDLLAPYQKGGKIGLFGGAGVGKTVLIMELINNVAKGHGEGGRAVRGGEAVRGGGRALRTLRCQLQMGASRWLPAAALPGVAGLFFRSGRPSHVAVRRAHALRLRSSRTRGSFGMCWRRPWVLRHLRLSGAATPCAVTIGLPFIALPAATSAGGFSVFAGVGERTREGNDLYREMIEGGVYRFCTAVRRSVVTTATCGPLHLKCSLCRGRQQPAPRCRRHVLPPRLRCNSLVHSFHGWTLQA